MTDVFDRATRSRVMARIQSKDTSPEITLRRYLHSQRLRFRLHAPDLPGRPDIVFPRYRVAVFVHGCFWHRHAGCVLAATPGTNRKFWKKKLEGNKARDKRHAAALMATGWRVAVFWECGARKGVVNPKALQAL